VKEPKKIPLTDNPRSKEPQRIPLKKSYPEPITQDLWIKNENHLENNSQSIQQLESD
jgi:hypothetical protein